MMHHIRFIFVDQFLFLALRLAPESPHKIVLAKCLQAYFTITIKNIENDIKP